MKQSLLGMKSLVLAVTGEYEQAKHILNTLKFLDPGNVDRLVASSIIEREAGNLATAFVYVQSVNEREPTFYTLFLESDIAHSLENYESAISSYEELESIQTADAMHFSDKALKVKYHPINTLEKLEHYRILIAHDYFALEDYDLAESLTNDYLTKFPDSTDGLILKGDIDYQKRNISDALHSYEKALSNDPLNDELRSKIDEIKKNLVEEFNTFLRYLSSIVMVSILAFTVTHHYWNKKNPQRIFTKPSGGSTTIIKLKNPKTRFGVKSTKKPLNLAHWTIEISSVIVTIILLMGINN